jgi:hypothetical protein
VARSARCSSGRARGLAELRLRTWWVGLAALCAALTAIVFATERWPSTRFGRVWGPNLAAELVGLVLTLVVIERLIRWQRLRELEPVRIVATRRMAHAVTQLMRVLALMYKSSAPPGSPEPERVDELVDCWLREVPHFNAASPAPFTPPRQWREHLTIEAREIEQLLMNNLDLYAEALGTEMVVAAEDFLHDISSTSSTPRSTPCLPTERRDARRRFS